jgi:hypothetical protein
MDEGMQGSVSQSGNLSEPALGTTPGGSPAADMRGVIDQAASNARALANRAKTTTEERIRAAASTGKSSAAETLGGVAQSLIAASAQLQGGQNPASGIVAQAGEALNQFAQSIDTAEVDVLVDRTQSWARRHPALFLGGAFALGIVAARFLGSTRADSGAGRGPAGFSDREVPTSSFVEG